MKIWVSSAFMFCIKPFICAFFFLLFSFFFCQLTLGPNLGLKAFQACCYWLRFNSAQSVHEDFNLMFWFFFFLKYIRFLSALIVCRLSKRETGLEWVSLIRSLVLHCWCNQEETGAEALLLPLTGCHDVTTADPTILTFLLIEVLCRRGGQYVREMHRLAHIRPLSKHWLVISHIHQHTRH